MAKKFFEIRRGSIRKTQLFKDFTRQLEYCESFKLIQTTTWQKLLDLMAAAVNPSAFKFITGREDIDRLYKLTLGKSPLVISKDRPYLSKLIIQGQGIMFLLSPKARKLVRDLTHLVNLISFNAMTRFELTRIDEEPIVWRHQLDNYSMQEVAAVSEKYDKSRQALEEGRKMIAKDGLTEDTLSEQLGEVAEGVFALRVGHLGLVDLLPDNPKHVQFLIEGNDVKQKVKSGNFYGVFTVGRGSYVSWAKDLAIPLFAIHNNSLQLVAKPHFLDEGRLRDGLRVPIDDEFKAAEWHLYQELALKQLGIKSVKPVNIDRGRYDDMAATMKSGDIDLATVAIPMDLHAESLRFWNVPQQSQIRLPKEQLPTVWVAATNDFAKEHPELFAYLVDRYEGIHRAVSPWPRFEFPLLKQTDELNRYYVRTLSLSTKDVEKVVDSHLRTVRVAG
jgi:hypothetical protein